MSEQARGAPTSYGWRIGSIAGAPVYLGKSWPVIAAAVVFIFAPQVAAVRPDQGMAYAYGVAALYALLLLISVLVHEAAHALVAQQAGYEVNRIVVHLLGGHTIYDSGGTRPGASALVAASGPVSNLVLAGLAYGLALVSPWQTMTLLLGAATFANLFVAVFNLLPGLPLDGGHLVESAVWGLTGSRGKGLVVAGWCGRLVTAVVLYWFLVRPLVQGEGLDPYTLIWVVMVGAFLWFGASRAISVGAMRARLEPLRAADLMRPVRLVDETGSVALALVGPAATLLVIGQDRRPKGIVDPDSVAAIPVSDRLATPVTAVTTRMPDPWVVWADPDGGVMEVVQAMQSGGASVVVVLGPEGEPVGCIHRADLDDAIGRAVGQAARPSAGAPQPTTHQEQEQ
jgi:Zn-dependent protease